MTNKKTYKEQESWRLATRLVRGGTMRSEFGETSEAIFLNSGYSYDSAEIAEGRFNGELEGYVYSRTANPTVTMFEERVALLENMPVAKATTTGMAAVYAALMCQLNTGDRVVAPRTLFGSCRVILDEFLPKYGIKVDYVDCTDYDGWHKAFKTPANAVFIETPANPTLEIVDLELVTKLAHNAGARVIIDNVLATPILQRPALFGCDIVVYSATKHFDGHGRCLGGCILSSQEFYDKYLNRYLRHTGPALSPFNAWVLLKGLETLELRVIRHCENALKIANYMEKLQGSGHLQSVIYPGLASHPQHDLVKKQMSGLGGTIITFKVTGNKQDTFAFMNRLKIIDISNNLGDAKSLITHPFSTTHSAISPQDRAAIGISDNMVRLSVGLEDPLDLINDIDQAIKK